MIPAPLIIPWQRNAEIERLRNREWLTTNGLGGFASGSLLGVPTRRYHGLFVPNLSDPKGRYVTIPRIDELVECDGELINLGGAEFCDGHIECQGHLYLREFRLDALVPTWVFDINGSVLEKSIVMPHGQNTVCIRYRQQEGPPLRLRLRLFAAARRQDTLLQPEEEWPFTLQLTGEKQELSMHHGSLMVRLKMTPTPCMFVAEPLIDRHVLYRIERDRGYDHSENHFSPGYFCIECRVGAETSFMATTESWEALQVQPAQLFAAERARLEQLTTRAQLPAEDEFALHLVMAVDQFVVVPGSRREEALLAAASGDTMCSVMAGYHWFNDWGRDTMIAFEGLTLCTGRHHEASAILRTFARYIRNGLVPNLFPEGEREALYHTVDATLWFFHALDRYLRRSGDETLLRFLYPTLQDIVEHHLRGTDFGIGVDPRDGLISAAAEGYQLTWMDAKVGDWVVTPRRGKPVEIQALWYNALQLMDEWSTTLGHGDRRYRELAEQVRSSFNARYWAPELRHLYDVLDGPEGDDASLRPNQIFALSLHHPVLDREHWRDVLDTVEQRLLTPVGLRTLDRDHPNYQRFYEGPLRARDAAYHQGTVWPWLLGHFVDAWVRVNGDAERGRILLREFPSHLLAAGVGSISEIFDAESPHHPRGCIAQAWSVAEILRAWLKTGGAHP